MRSRPPRTRRRLASFGSAPISGTVQICGLDLASCAELVGTPPPSGHANSHKDASAITPMGTPERAQSINPSPTSARFVGANAPSRLARPRDAFVQGFFLPTARHCGLYTPNAVDAGGIG